MIGYIVIAALVAAWIWIVYEARNAPLVDDDEIEIDDPTTTCWHDDEIKN